MKVNEAKLKLKKEKDEIGVKNNDFDQKLQDEKAKVLKYLKEKEQAQNALRAARQ